MPILKMKYFMVIIISVFTPDLFSQNEVDAIRYSEQYTGSTARSFGVAGAFGAIGADPSCAAINPAGLARFRTAKFYFSMALFNAKTKSTYLGNEVIENKFNINLPNVGFIVNFRGADYNEKKPKGFVNYVLAFNVNRINNFHQQNTFYGRNKTSSITQEWAERGYNITPDNMSPYSLEYLAYKVYAIDPDTNATEPRYKSAYGNNAINVNQSSSNESKGAMNDYSVALAANYRQIIQGGISIGIKSVRYIETNSFIEEDMKTSNIKDIRSVTLDKYLKTKGTGFNAKLGIVYSPSEYFRFGYSFHTPTVYNLTDSYSYTINTVFDYGAKDIFGTTRSDSKATTNSTGYNYKVTSPSRNVMSMGLINKEIGFISLDVEYVNYRGASLNAEDYKFISENTHIKNTYSGKFNFRMGTEIISDKFRYRAGYARYPSAYKNNDVPDLKNLVNNVYTLGFGIKTDKFSFDIAYVNSSYSNYYTPYTLANGSQPTATNKVRTTNVVFTLGLNLD